MYFIAWSIKDTQDLMIEAVWKIINIEIKAVLKIRKFYIFLNCLNFSYNFIKIYEKMEVDIIKN